MLKTEQIEKNTKKYFETAQKFNFMNDEFMNFLGVAFIKAPASTMQNLNNAFEGGLIDHLLRTTKFAISVNDILPENLKVSKESLIKVCLLYQIGKAHMFTPCTSEWHRTNQGKMYEFDTNLSPLKVGERSVFYALNNNVTLSDDEYSAIINHDKSDDDLQSKYHNTMLGDILKIANILAIKEEKK